MAGQGFFSRFIQVFKESLVELNLEADLFPVGADRRGPEAAEIEYYVHTVGKERSLRFKLKTPRPELVGQQVEILIAACPAFTFPLEPGRSRKRWYTKDGDTVPGIAIGDSAEIRIGGKAVWEGAFEKD